MTRKPNPRYGLAVAAGSVGAAVVMFLIGIGLGIFGELGRLVDSSSPPPQAPGVLGLVGVLGWLLRAGACVLAVLGLIAGVGHAIGVEERPR
ncbi:hypothetical protein EV193_101162 [Herbihabitans rhizosphaerae]|uniref:Uncharacterized protein n=1 Tax=Herbihabitans rhizosphaerae TaxID=1872711 RepID=A0A4Q7L4S8_9PSEU|nr:hypothetical protein [Herbihabitans rhizosphaerae]RZS44287.1 hypothetical protein EV193_101162 [Herbihabitans rhizosphaerae]